MAPGAISPQPLETTPAMSPLQPALKRSIAETTDPSSPLDSKRKKVMFEEEPQVHHLNDNAEEKPVALIREEIKHAIRRRYDGDGEEYDKIKGIFTANKDSDDAPSDDLLRKYLVGFTQNATSLDKSCSDLVHAILNLQWLGREDAFVSTYIRFLGNLVSSQTGFLPAVLRMLVENFAHLSTSAGKQAVRLLADRLKFQGRVHSCMKYLLRLIPSASSALSPVLASCYPFSTDTKKAHVEYVRNVLHITAYAPELKGEVLDLVTERLIKIDVQTQIDIEDLEEIFEGDIGDMVTQGTQVEGNGTTKPNVAEDQSDVEEESESEDEPDDDERKYKELQESVEKMDAIIDSLFAYHSPSFAKGDHMVSHAMFNQLLSQFRKTILPSHRSRHVQFLLFHFAQTSEEFTSLFVKQCTEMLMDKTFTATTRTACAAYLASFIARGAKISPNVVGWVFEILCGYMNKLLKEYAPTCKHPSLQRYGVYYATAQAVMYIFCFRWRDLLADPEDYEDESYEDLFDGRPLTFMPGIKDTIIRNCESRLNPLKVCAPEIVEEFAHISHKLSFAYVHQYIERNKRIRLTQLALTDKSASSGLRQTALSELRGERHQQLDAYFPFDPYRLPKSKKWLVGDYNEWKGVPGAVELPGAEEADSSEEEDDDDGDDVDAMDTTEVGPTVEMSPSSD